MNRFEDCDASLQRALGLIPPVPASAPRAIALAHASLSAMYVDDLERAQLIARQAVAVADEVDDPVARIHAHNAMAASLAGSSTRSEADEHIGIAVALCGPDVPCDVAMIAFNGYANECWRQTRLHDLITIASRAIEVARRSGVAGPRAGWLAMNLVGALVDSGRWDDAERTFEEVGDLLAGDALDASACIAQARIRRGGADAARAIVERLVEKLDSSEMLDRRVWPEQPNFYVATIIEWLAAVGERSRVVGYVDDLLAGRWGDPNQHAAEPVALAIRALADQLETEPAVARQGAVAGITQIAQHWVSILESLTGGGFSPLLEIRRELAQCELSRLTGHRTPEAWIHNAEQWAAASQPHGEAYSRWGAARALVDARPRASARELAKAQLVRGHEIANILGAGPLLSRISACWRDARLGRHPSIEPPRDERGTAHALLTPRETQILALVAQGRTNVQIANSLGISTKTASVHVSNILRKLGVTNRVEAAYLALRSDGDLVRAL
jgi:DNA-binding CsgD family transcriptional regulator